MIFCIQSERKEGITLVVLRAGNEAEAREFAEEYYGRFNESYSIVDLEEALAFFYDGFAQLTGV